MTDFKAWIPPAGAVVNPPVHPETEVDVIFSDRSEAEGMRARCINWSADGDGPCVIAYAIVEEYKPAPKVAREWWIVGDCEAWDSEREALESASRLYANRPPIHVREVLEGHEVVAWAVVQDGQRLLTTQNEIAAGQYADDHGGTVVKLTGVMP